jgi:ubiquinone/menaquinone biosynthesis C-methylase UbiE
MPLKLLHKLIYKIDHHTNIFAAIEKNRANDIDRIFRIKEWFIGNPSVLDIGCGVGDLTSKISDYTNNMVVGIDMIDFRRKGIKDDPTFNFIRANVEAIPFYKNSFDRVTLFWTLHHIKNPLRYIDTFVELVKNQGEIIILEDIVDKHNPINRIFTKYYDKIVNLEFIGHPHSNYSLSEWEEYFTINQNLKLIEKSEYKYILQLNLLKFGMLRFRVNK